MLHDRIVCGINNVTVQRKLLSESNLDLEKAVAIALALEAASMDLGDLQRGNRGDKETVNFMKKTSKAQFVSGKLPRSTIAKVEKKECWRCGGTSHSARRCKFKDEKCFKCQQRGHTGKKCADVQEWRKQHYVTKETDEEIETVQNFQTVNNDDVDFVFHMQNRVDKVDLFEVDVTIKGKNVTFGGRYWLWGHSDTRKNP